MKERLASFQAVDRKPTAWIADGQVQIRALGEIPACLRLAQQALARGDLHALQQQLESPQLMQVQTSWNRSPVRVDLALMVVRLLEQLERYGEALSWCRKIEGIEPSGLLYWQMAELLMHDTAQPDHMSQARLMAERSVERDPENLAFIHRLAILECRTGLLEQGLEHLRILLQRSPDTPLFLSNWLWYHLYSPTSTRALFAQGYRRLARLQPALPNPPECQNDPDPDRPLRVGFISPDFRRCAAARSLEAVIDGLRQSSLKLYAYVHVRLPDDTTKRISSKFHQYRDVFGWPPSAIAERIRQDRVDILIEIGGFVKDHALEVFRYRPAPIQMDYHGLATTGMSEMDYRVTDAYLDPPGGLGDYTERSIFLHGVHCFCPPQISPLIGPLPALSNGYVTFGSLNNHFKITDSMIQLWARILLAVPNSRLIIKSLQGDDRGIKQLIKDKFMDWGVVPDRLEWIEPIPSHQAHLDLYNRIDLCLDTFPFNGCITTFESLWMGVPVLTRVGETFVSRVGLSMLSHLDLAIFCSHNDQEYVDKAISFANQLESLAALRPSLRSRLLASPLCDPRRMARELEQAFRSMWRQWCAER